MQCLYEISCESRWNSQQRTFHQEVGSLSIGGGVGGARNLGGDSDVGGDCSDDSLGGVVRGKVI